MKQGFVYYWPQKDAIILYTKPFGLPGTFISSIDLRRKVLPVYQLQFLGYL